MVSLDRNSCLLQSQILWSPCGSPTKSTFVPAGSWKESICLLGIEHVGESVNRIGCLPVQLQVLEKTSSQGRTYLQEANVRLVGKKRNTRTNTTSADADLPHIGKEARSWDGALLRWLSRPGRPVREVMCERGLRLTLRQQVSQKTSVARGRQDAKQGQARPVSLLRPGCSLLEVCWLPVLPYPCFSCHCKWCSQPSRSTSQNQASSRIPSFPSAPKLDQLHPVGPTCTAFLTPSPSLPNTLPPSLSKLPSSLAWAGPVSRAQGMPLEGPL